MHSTPNEKFQFSSIEDVTFGLAFKYSLNSILFKDLIPAKIVKNLTPKCK